MINTNWWHFKYRDSVYFASQEDYISYFGFGFDQTTFLIAALSEMRE